MSQTAFGAPNLWSLSGGGIYVGSKADETRFSLSFAELIRHDP